MAVRLARARDEAQRKDTAELQVNALLFCRRSCFGRRVVIRLSTLLLFSFRLRGVDTDQGEVHYIYVYVGFGTLFVRVRVFGSCLLLYVNRFCCEYYVLFELSFMIQWSRGLILHLHFVNNNFGEF